MRVLQPIESDLCAYCGHGCSIALTFLPFHDFRSQPTLCTHLVVITKYTCNCCRVREHNISEGRGGSPRNVWAASFCWVQCAARKSRHTHSNRWVQRCRAGQYKNYAAGRWFRQQLSHCAVPYVKVSKKSPICPSTVRTISQQHISASLGSN